MRVEYREEPCRTALNRVRGMPFAWSLNPYSGCAHRCAFCYVRAFEARADRPADGRYGASIRVKTNVAGVLRAELARRSWRGEAVAIGAATDPYQPAEGRYRLTRACLEALADAANPFTLITRGPLVVRDLDVLARAAGRADVSVAFSVPTLDEEVWRRTEPSTAPPRQRLRALSRVVEAGIRASVAVAPVLPGISDRPEQLEAVVRAAREAGACGVWPPRCTCGRARASTSSPRSRSTGRSSSPSTSASTRAARTCRGRGRADPRGRAGARAGARIRDRRRLRLAPPPPPEQLALLPPLERR